jgi:surface protein
VRRGSRDNNGFVGLNLKVNYSQGIITPNKEIQSSPSTWNAWIRPSNWLPMPSMTAGDQKIALIAAVAGPTGATIGASSLFALSVSGCTYTVDWGNGFTQSYPSNSVASYGLYYDELPESTTVKPGFGLSGFGFEEFNGYRQALVQVYPTVAGTTFAGFHLRPTQVNAGENPRFPTLAYRLAEIAPDWISCKFASSTLTTAVFTSSRTLQEVEIIGSTGITNGTSMFIGCRQLKKLSGTEWCSNVVNFMSMFNGCVNLSDVPLLNTSSGINMSNMFVACSSLKKVPQFNTSNVTNMSFMFSGCSTIFDIPNLNMVNVVEASGMFSNCRNLSTIPNLNTQNVQNFSQMFGNCSNLKRIPSLNFSSGITFGSMFTGCLQLEEANIPAISNAARFLGSMFIGCSSLKKVNLPNTGNVDDFSSMFSTCPSLESVSINMASARFMSSMFSGCHSLTDVNLLNLNSPTLVLATSPFSGCFNLQRIRLNGLVQGPLDLSGAVSGVGLLSPDALNELYESLGTVATTKTLTVTGNWGFNASNRSIATAKGWNVV